MAELTSIERKLAELEGRVTELSNQMSKDYPPEEKKKSWLSWDLARNLIWVVGIPAALFGAWTTVKDDIINFGKKQRMDVMEAAVRDLEALQAHNAEIFSLQARQDEAAAFALIDAKRGRVERLTKNLYEAWQRYPDEFTPSEATALVEALMAEDRTDQALAVFESVDQSQMRTIQQGDMDILKARVLFSRGPAQDPEAAREAFRDAMRHAESLEDKGQQLALMEKYAGVRLINELWLGTPCADVLPFSGFLTDLVEDDKEGLVIDLVRQNTKDVLVGHQLKCGDGG